MTTICNIVPDPTVCLEYRDIFSFVPSDPSWDGQGMYKVRLDGQGYFGVRLRAGSLGIAVGLTKETELPAVGYSHLLFGVLKNKDSFSVVSNGYLYDYPPVELTDKTWVHFVRVGGRITLYVNRAPLYEYSGGELLEGSVALAAVLYAQGDAILEVEYKDLTPAVGSGDGGFGLSGAARASYSVLSEGGFQLGGAATAYGGGTYVVGDLQLTGFGRSGIPPITGSCSGSFSLGGYATDWGPVFARGGFFLGGTAGGKPSDWGDSYCAGSFSLDGTGRQRVRALSSGGFLLDGFASDRVYCSGEGGFTLSGQAFSWVIPSFAGGIGSFAMAGLASGVEIQPPGATGSFSLGGRAAAPDAVTGAEGAFTLRGFATAKRAVIENFFAFGLELVYAGNRLSDGLAITTQTVCSPVFPLFERVLMLDRSTQSIEVIGLLQDQLELLDTLFFITHADQTDTLNLNDTLRGDFIRLALMAEHLVMSEGFNATIETTAYQQDTLALDDSLAFVIRVLMADGIDFDTTVIPDPHLFCRMAERIAFSDSFATLSTLKAAMADSVEFAEAVRFVARVVLGDTLDFDTQATDADVLRVGQMADKIALLTRNAAVLETLVGLADALVFQTSIDLSFKCSMADTLAVSTEVTARLIALCAQMDVLELVDRLAGSMVFFARTTDAIDFIDHQNPTLTALLRQKDVLAFVGRLPLGDEDYQAWVLNSDSLGVTEYTNFQFNSLANWKGRTFGLTDTALYELTGDDDEGDPINALLRTGDLTLGSSNHKTTSRAYLYLTSTDDVYFKTVSTWRGRRDETWYRVNYREDADDGQTRRVRLGKGLRGTTWAFELQNIDGGDFDVRGAEVLPVLLSRKV